MDRVGGLDLIVGLQERAARAMPAEVVEDEAGWWLRHAPRCAWWVSAVLPHGPAGPDELARRVAATERFYAARGAVPRFQLSPVACPPDLDALLADRGYRHDTPASLQIAATAEVAQAPPAGPLRVALDDRPTTAWIDTWHAVGHGGDPDAERDLLARVDRPSCYASGYLGPDVVAVGRAVADDGWAGVFSMATLPRARGQGAGRRVLAALAAWAASQGADGMYLQMEPANTAALRLYGRAGFTELCAYHYRVAAR